MEIYFSYVKIISLLISSPHGFTGLNSDPVGIKKLTIILNISIEIIMIFLTFVSILISDKSALLVLVSLVFCHRSHRYRAV